jgi:hypothetical protein
MKHKLIKPVFFVALVLLMLVTGVFWGTWFTLTRSLETFSPAEFLHIGQTIISNVAVPMRIIMPLCIVLMIFSAWLYLRRNQQASTSMLRQTFLLLSRCSSHCWFLSRLTTKSDLGRFQQCRPNSRRCALVGLWTSDSF